MKKKYMYPEVLPTGSSVVNRLWMMEFPVLMSYIESSETLGSTQVLKKIADDYFLKTELFNFLGYFGSRRSKKGSEVNEL